MSNECVARDIGPILQYPLSGCWWPVLIGKCYLQQCCWGWLGGAEPILRPDVEFSRNNLAIALYVSIQAWQSRQLMLAMTYAISKTYHSHAACSKRCVQCYALQSDCLGKSTNRWPLGTGKPVCTSRPHGYLLTTSLTVNRIKCTTSKHRAIRRGWDQ